MLVDLTHEQLGELRCALEGHRATIGKHIRDLGDRRDADGVEHAERHWERANQLLEIVSAVQRLGAPERNVQLIRHLIYALSYLLHTDFVNLEDDDPDTEDERTATIMGGLLFLSQLCTQLPVVAAERPYRANFLIETNDATP